MKLTLPPIRSGDTVQLPHGICQCDQEELLLDGLNDVVIQGYQGTELVTASLDPIVRITDGSNIILRDVTLRGPGPLRSPNSIYTALVSLSGPYDGLRFENVRLLDMPNHGIADLNTRTGHNVEFIRCSASNGGNYGTNPALIWDGAAFAVGVPNVRYSYCRVENCIRAFEMENPRGNCSFSLDHCRVTGCSHVGAWVIPTGFQTGTTGQVFTGSITNCVFENGTAVPGPYNPSGIIVSGGQDIVISNNLIRGFPVGTGIHVRADMAVISNVSIAGNIVRGCKVGIVFAAGIEGVKATADNARITGNIITGAQDGYDLVTTGATRVEIV